LPRWRFGGEGGDCACDCAGDCNCDAHAGDRCPGGPQGLNCDSGDCNCCNSGEGNIGSRCPGRLMGPNSDCDDCNCNCDCDCDCDCECTGGERECEWETNGESYRSSRLDCEPWELRCISSVPATSEECTEEREGTSAAGAAVGAAAGSGVVGSSALALAVGGAAGKAGCGTVASRPGLGSSTLTSLDRCLAVLHRGHTPLQRRQHMEHNCHGGA
jgi:hypothetical protein